MTKAIFGVIGVVIGALISGFVSLWLERRREQHLSRAGARLLEQELEPFHSLLYELRAGVRQRDEPKFVRHAKERFAGHENPSSVIVALVVNHEAGVLVESRSRRREHGERREISGDVCGRAQR